MERTSQLIVYLFRSLTVMFEILKSHGEMMKEEWWNDLFKIIYRIFEHAKQEDGRTDVSLSLNNPLIMDSIIEFVFTVN